MAPTRIMISRRVNVTDSNSKTEVSDADRLRLLDGLTYDEMLISEYISNDELNDLEISGGTIALRFEPETGQLRVISEFAACRKLRKAELQMLVEETEGQWSDGIGSDGTELFPNVDPSIALDFCFGAADLRVEQVADATKARPRRTLARAAQKGDIEKIRQAIAAGESINSAVQGIPAVRLAIMYGHPDAAIFLIENGAEVVGDASPLVGCAHLEEAAAIRVATAVVARGGISTEQLSVAYDAASSAWKMELANFLVQHGADPHHREKELQREMEVRRFEDMRRARRRRNSEGY